VSQPRKPHRRNWRPLAEVGGTAPPPHLILAAPEAVGPGWHPQAAPAFLRRLQRAHASKAGGSPSPATDSVARSNGRTEATSTPQENAPTRAPLESPSRTEEF
jgi:hypothetical protein